MGSNGRIPPHLRRPLPGLGMLHQDPFVPPSGIHPPPGAFAFDMLPPEIVGQQLIVQHEEMQMLVTENRRFASTHFDLRQDLAAAQQELQKLQTHMSAVKDEQEQQMRGLLDNMVNMKVDLHASEPVKVEYQQVHAEAQSLVAARQELILKVQQLTQDLQKSHGDVQQIPALMSELEALRQEYQQYRATYDYEKKLYTNHYESLQVMEKNYVSMVREVQKLRAEFANAANLERSGGTYGSNAGYKENDTSGHHSVGQKAYEDGIGVSQVCRPPPGSAAPYGGGEPVPTPAWAGYDAPKGPGGYDAPKNVSYNPSWGASYDPSIGGSYETPRGAGGVQAAIVPGNSAPPYGSGPAPNPYGLAQRTPPPPYGSRQVPNSYGSAQAMPPPFGSEQTSTPVQAPHGGNVGH